MKLEFKDERDTDFMETYHSVIKRHAKKAVFMKRDSLLQETIDSPAKRFYVSEEQAVRTISRMLRGETPGCKSPLKKKMYKEIFKRVVACAMECDDTLTDIIYKVVNSEAPCFYIGLKTARILYYKLMRLYK